ncbi:lipopolysaccharide biosynthesis protein [Devosia sp. 2618]|uniref:lipopolysaccharide biosynthesis protein n=1 Tax=Devosia sp. 2618 TaxID=3156454 RepID=UPI0033959249
MSSARSFKSIIPMGLSYLASGGSLITSSAAQLLTFAILARSLGVLEFSYFVGLTAITAVAVQLCGLGAQEALVRRVARDWSVFPVMLGHNIIMSAATGAILVVAGLFVLPLFFTLSADPLLNLGALGLFLIANIILTRAILFVEQVFIAHSMFAAANRNVVLYAVGRLAAAVLGCLVFGVDNLAEWAVWNFVAHVIIAIITVRSVRGLGMPKFGIVRDELRNGMLFCTPFVLRALRQNMDLLLLTAFTSPEIVASYGVARRMIDSGYLSVEALNRLLYPGSAAATANGLRHGMTRFRKVVMASLGISVFTAIVLVVTSPLLPILFGHEYVSLPGFVRIMAFAIVFIAVCSTALEALGSSGHQLQRAIVLNSASILGGMLVALCTWQFGVNGTFAANYMIEAGTAAAAWIMLLQLAKKDQRNSAPVVLDREPVTQP